MVLVYIILVGGIIGWLAASLLGRKEGFFGSIVIGIIGSFIGSFLASLFGGTVNNYLSFRWAGLFWSFIGAVLLVAILNFFSKRTNKDQA